MFFPLKADRPARRVHRSQANRRDLCRWHVVLVALGLFLLTLTARAGSLADLDRDNGLPDAKLTTPLANFQGLVKTEDVGRWLTFKRNGDQLRYGKFSVSGITYNFFKDRLYSIQIDIVGKSNVKGIIKLLENEYGKDHSKEILPLAKTNTYLEVREWAAGKVYCVMKNSYDNEGGVLTLLDKPTWDMLQVPKREKMQQSKQMLDGSFLDATLGQPTPPPTASPEPMVAPQPPRSAQ